MLILHDYFCKNCNKTFESFSPKCSCGNLNCTRQFLKVASLNYSDLMSDVKKRLRSDVRESLKID